MTSKPLTPEMEEVIDAVLHAECLRVSGDHIAESEALSRLELLCDDLSLDELLIALKHVMIALQQKMRKH